MEKKLRTKTPKRDKSLESRDQILNQFLHYNTVSVVKNWKLGNYLMSYFPATFLQVQKKLPLLLAPYKIQANIKRKYKFVHSFTGNPI